MKNRKSTIKLDIIKEITPPNKGGNGTTQTEIIKNFIAISKIIRNTERFLIE